MLSHPLSSSCCKFKHISDAINGRLKTYIKSNKFNMLFPNLPSSVRYRASSTTRHKGTCKAFLRLLSLSCTLLLLIYSSSSSANQRHYSNAGQQQQQQPQQQPQPQQQQQLAIKPNHRNQSATTSHSNQQRQRPLDRPSLTLVGNFSSPPEIPDGAADWFMMGGGDDLMIDEARNVASFADSGRPGNATIRSTRRMAEMKQHRKHSKGSNKTVFDDEQSPDASDSNEIYDDAEEGASLAGTQKEPECASHGRYYCTFKEDYPLKLVTEVTKYYKWPLEKLFRDLHAQIMPKLAQDSTGNLVCDSITRVVRPGWARNTNDRWLVVINTDNYHQYVTEVVCQYGTNSRCNFIPPCYYSSCQQRYNTQKLLVIDPSNPYRGPFLSEFLFPSCCVCYVPSSSDSLQDKYRSSPATIYQRTMQQEAASNIHPPQFRPPQMSLLEEAFGSAGLMAAGGGGGGGSQVEPISSASRTSASGVQLVPGQPSPAGGGLPSAGVAQAQLPGSKAQPAGPGEIRRAGDQYRRQLEQQQFEGESRQGRQHEPSGGGGGGDSFRNDDLASFPRLGLSDSLLNQRSALKE